MKTAMKITITLCMLWAMGAGADPLVWDALPGNGQAEDGSGIWVDNAANTNWWNQTQNVRWPNNSSDIAVFGANNGAAGAVAVSGTVTAGGLMFTNAGSGTYALGGGTISLAGSNPEINTFTNARIRSEISGTAGLVKTAAGILTLEGAKNYSGDTVVSAGILTVAPTAPPVTNSLLVWLDADDAATLILDSSNRVSAWASKGTYTGNASASGTDRPTFTYGVLNGRSTIRFDETLSNKMDNVGALTAANFASSNASMFVVWTVNNDVQYGVVSTAAAGQEYWRLNGAGYTCFSMFRVNRINGWEYPSVIMPTTGTHALGLTMSAADNAYRIWLDGTQVFNIATNDFALQTTLQLGYGVPNTTFLNGDIAEVLIYTNALSEADRLKVQSYLNAKWLGVGSGASSSSNLLPTNTAVRVAAGATLNLSLYADQTLVSLADSGGGGGAVVVGSGALTVGDASNAVFSGSVSGAGGLTKTGAGVLSLMGTNTYSGITRIDAGTLELGQTTIRGDITNNATLAFTLTGTNTYLGAVSGSGSLVKQGSGVLSFAADQTYTGATVVSGGTLSLGVPGAPVAGSLLVWLDAADAATITKDGGNLVSAWASKGSYTGSVSAAGTDRPTFTAGALNSHSVIRFYDAQSNKMDNVGALTAANFAGSNASMFVVWTLNNDTWYDVVCTAGAGSEYWRWKDDGHFYFSMFRANRINWWVYDPPLTTIMPTTGTHMLDLTMSATGNTYRIWLDGAQVVNISTNDFALQATLQLGYSAGGTFLNGDIAEVLIYTNALSESDRQKVQSYLNAKWQVGLVPSGAGSVLAGSRQITVASGATLDLAGATNSMLNTNALLRLNGVINLEAGSTQTVWRLNLDNSAAAMGTWGATGSGAAHVNDTYFDGTGVLKVSETIARGSVMIFK